MSVGWLFLGHFVSRVFDAPLIKADSVENVPRPVQLFVSSVADFFPLFFGEMGEVVDASRILLIVEGFHVFGRDGDEDVRENALLMNGSFVWRVVFCGGEAERRAVRLLQDALDRTFAEGFFADDNSPLPVLEAPGHDFRSAGTAAIDQHDHRDVEQRILRPPRAPHRVRGRFLPSHGNDELPRLDELFGNFHSLIQQSSRVASKVEDERFHVLFDEPVDSLLKIGAGFLAKLNNPNVANAILAANNPARPVSFFGDWPFLRVVIS